MSKKASIIIPAHNEGVWLRYTVESIIANAEYSDFEIIVVDDGSTDGCSDLPNYSAVHLQIIKVDRKDKHGPAVSRNRALEQIKGDVIVTFDAHEAMSTYWLTRMMNVHAENPRAFLQGVCTGMRAAADIERKSVGIDADEATLAATLLQASEDHPTSPLMIEVGKTITDVQRASLQERLGVPVVPAHNRDEVKEGEFIICIKATTAGDLQHDPFKFPGAVLDFDPEDRNFFTPKWNPWVRLDSLNGRMLRTNALMGACYLFPRDLFEKHVVSWPFTHGWCHEEPYLSICANMADIPILVIPDVVFAHNYDRRVSGHDQRMLQMNRELTLAMCFDDMLESVWKRIRQDEVRTDFGEFQKRFEQQRATLQANRVVSDKEWLGRAGLLQYFDKKAGDKARHRLGASIADVSQLDGNALEAFMDSLKNCPNVGWMWWMAHTKTKNEWEMKRKIWAAQWNEERGMRDMSVEQHDYRRNMFGAVDETLTALEVKTSDIAQTPMAEISRGATIAIPTEDKRAVIHFPIPEDVDPTKLTVEDIEAHIKKFGVEPVVPEEPKDESA